MTMLEPIRLPEYNQPVPVSAPGVQPSHREAEFVRAGQN